MAEIRIDFEWQQDTKGYRLEKARPLRRDESLVYHPFGIRVLSAKDARAPVRVVRCGGPIATTRPLVHFDGLFKQFANIRDQAGVLDFIEKFGPLTHDGLDQEIGESVTAILIHAETMRDVLEWHAGGKRPDVLVESQANPLSAIGVALVLDPVTRAPRLQLRPSTLLGALWLQLGQALSGNANIQRCQHCGTWFERGSGTGRRLDAKFCSDQHRFAFNSLRRTREK